MKKLEVEWYYVYVSLIREGGEISNKLVIDFNTPNKNEAYDKFTEWVSDYCDVNRSDGYMIALMLNNHTVKEVFFISNNY